MFTQFNHLFFKLNGKRFLFMDAAESPQDKVKTGMAESAKKDISSMPQVFKDMLKAGGGGDASDTARVAKSMIDAKANLVPDEIDGGLQDAVQAAKENIDQIAAQFEKVKDVVRNHADLETKVVAGQAELEKARSAEEVSKIVENGRICKNLLDNLGKISPEVKEFLPVNFQNQYDQLGLEIANYQLQAESKNVLSQTLAQIDQIKKLTPAGLLIHFEDLNSAADMQQRLVRLIKIMTKNDALLPDAKRQLDLVEAFTKSNIEDYDKVSPGFQKIYQEYLASMNNLRLANDAVVYPEKYQRSKQSAAEWQGGAQANFDVKNKEYKNAVGFIQLSGMRGTPALAETPFAQGKKAPVEVSTTEGTGKNVRNG